LRGGLQHPDVGRFRGEVALEYHHVDNRAWAGTLVPDYRADTIAVMAFEEARFFRQDPSTAPRLILSAGVRTDLHRLAADRPTGREASEHDAVTGSLGVVVRLRESVALAGSVARGWRPPSAFELYAFGVHGGVAAFQVGNPTLGEESNVSGELALRYQAGPASASFTAYRNAFNDYIYLADSGETIGTLPAFVYRQVDATLDGAEVAVDILPRAWLRLGAAGSLLRTRNRGTGRQLPQTPANRVRASVDLRRAALGSLRELFVALEASLVGDADVSGPDEPLGTPTRAYEVVDLRAGCSVPAGPTTLDVAVSVRNLLDREYTDFLWSYKPFAPNPGRDLRVAVSWRF
jgi:iron complex outermembrane receptor protein/hemoglobin/transferrin/lactoferrin receptor protein